MGKTFLGVSYIIMAIPYVGLIGAVLLPIAWLIEGRSKRRGLWVAAGIVGIIAIVLSFIGIAMLASAVAPIMSRFSATLGNPLITTGTSASQAVGERISKELMLAVRSSVMGMAGAVTSLLAAAIYLVFYIITLITLHQAGNYYHSLMIKIGMGLNVVALLSAILTAFAAVPTIQGAALGHPALALTAAGTLATLVVLFIANIITGIGFLSAREPREVEEAQI